MTNEATNGKPTSGSPNVIVAGDESIKARARMPRPRSDVKSATAEGRTGLPKAAGFVNAAAPVPSSGASDLRMKPCPTCNTTPPNWRHQRSVFRMAGGVTKTRCNNCGTMETIQPKFAGCDEAFPELSELEEAA